MLRRCRITKWYVTTLFLEIILISSYKSLFRVDLFMIVENLAEDMHRRRLAELELLLLSHEGKTVG